MMWFIIIIAFVLLECFYECNSLNSDTIILLGGGGAFVYNIVHLVQNNCKKQKRIITNNNVKINNFNYFIYFYDDKRIKRLLI